MKPSLLQLPARMILMAVTIAGWASLTATTSRPERYSPGLNVNHPHGSHHYDHSGNHNFDPHHDGPAYEAIYIYQHHPITANQSHLISGLKRSMVSKPIPQDKWVKLAGRTANYTVDHSQIIFDGLEQSLTAMRIKVNKGALNLHRCAVFYKNGQTQDIDILNSIPEGGQSKVIEIPASSRIITKVVFTYDTKNRAIRQAEVELWGRQH